MLSQRGVVRISGLGAFEFTNVLGEAFGDEVQHIAGDFRAVHRGDHAKNGDSGLQIRRLDVYGQAGFEARDESSLETLLILGRYIGSNDNTLICLMQCIERMEELIQGGFLAAEELNIVN